MSAGTSAVRTRASWLATLGVVVVLCLCAALSGCGGAKNPVTLRVIYAGSLLIPFPEVQKEFEAENPGVTIESESHGSIQVLRQVSDIHQKADVLISADVNLIPLLLYNSTPPGSGQPYADWYVEFATNEMAIAYTDKSAHAAEIDSDDWYRVITMPDVRVGIADPRFDANGYRALMVLKLAEARYDAPTLFFDFFDGKLVTPITATLEGSTSVIHVPEIVETRSGSNVVMRGYSVQLLPLLETGDIDYAIEYLSVIKQHGLKYVTLPPELNLGSREDRAAYAGVTVRLDYQRFASVKPEFPGEPIGYGVTIPSDAPHAKEAADFVAYLIGADGRRILGSYDHPTLDPPESDHPELLPAVLKELCTALR